MFVLNLYFILYTVKGNCSSFEINTMNNVVNKCKYRFILLDPN